MTELLGDAYGKGRRRRNAEQQGDRADVAAMLARPNRAWDVDSDEDDSDGDSDDDSMKNPSRERTRRSTPRTRARRRRNGARRLRRHVRIVGERSGGVASRDRLPLPPPPSRPPPPRRARRARVDRMLTSAGTTGRRERDAARAGDAANATRVSTRSASRWVSGTNGRCRANRPARHAGGHARARGSSPRRGRSPRARPRPPPGAGSYPSPRRGPRRGLGRDARGGNARASRRRAVTPRGIERGTLRCRRPSPRRRRRIGAHVAGDLAEWRRAASSWRPARLVLGRRHGRRRGDGARDGRTVARGTARTTRRRCTRRRPERPHPLAVAARRRGCLGTHLRRGAAWRAGGHETAPRAPGGPNARGRRCPPRWRRRPSRRRRTRRPRSSPSASRLATRSGSISGRTPRRWRRGSRRSSPRGRGARRFEDPRG